MLKAIVDGELAPGDTLPSEGQLCERFGVSRITVRKALDELAAHHIVVRRQGVGTFVSEVPREGWSVTLTGVIEDVLAPTNMTIVKEGTVRPPSDVLRLAGLPPETRLRFFEGTNNLPDGSPLLHVRYYFPPPVGDKMSKQALTGTAQAIKLVEQNLRLRIDHAEQRVEPVNAGGVIARRLKVSPGTAVLRAIRIYYDIQQRPIEIFDAAYHPTHYRFTAILYPRHS